MNGFIPISRKIFESHEWLEVRQYSRFEAWFDLIQQARFEDGSRFIGYKEVILKRGEVAISLRFLAERWRWSNHKVDNYLSFLVKQKRIVKKTDKGTGCTVLTLCKYEQYNGMSDNYGTLNGTPGGHQGDTRGTNRKKDNKDNKDNTISSLSAGHEDENYGTGDELPTNQATEHNLTHGPATAADVDVFRHPEPIEHLQKRYLCRGFPQQELVMRAVPTHCRSHDDVWMWLDRFTSELAARGESHKSWMDFQSHFVNWLKIQPLPKNNVTKTTKTDNRRDDMQGSKERFAGRLISAQQEFEQGLAANGEADRCAAEAPKIIR